MIALKDTLGINYSMNMNDVINVKEALYNLGHYTKPSCGITAYPDEKLFSAIK